MGTKAVALVLALLVAAGPTSGVAMAHALYERSVPAADATVIRPPDRVEVWFTGELFRRARANTLAVIGPAGDEVQGGETLLDATDKRRMSVSLRAGLPEGGYVVWWTTLSTDGDEAAGSFRFTIGPAPPAADASSQSTADPPSSSGISRLLVPLGAAAVLAAMLVTLALRRRRGRSESL